MNIVENLKNVYGEKFEFFPFRNVTRSKVICKCNNCGKEYIRGYNNLKTGCLLCECEKKKKWPNEKIISFLQKKYNNFTFNVAENIDEEGNAEIECTCKKCGNQIKMKFRTLRYYNVLCKKCEYVVHNKLQEKKVIDYIINKGYDIICGSYINEDSLFKIRCKDCGDEITTSYKRLKQQKKGCRKCQYNLLRKDDATYRKEIEERYKGKITPITEYNGINKKITFKCNVCGNVWTANPDSVLNKGIGCHMCNKGVSYPNKFMKNLLTFFNEEIKIEEEKPLKKINGQWEGCHRFDFLVTKNGKKFVIEMDGGFHKRPNIKEIDEKKENFAKSNGIDVIRIDCDYKGINNRFKTIKNATLNSGINKLIDINRINDEQWEEINDKSENSSNKEIYDFYLANREMSFKEIGKNFHKRGDSIKNIINNFNKHYGEH